MGTKHELARKVTRLCSVTVSFMVVGGSGLLSQEVVSYQRDVLPILADHCLAIRSSDYAM